MNLITEIYYLIFKKMSRNPKAKYFLMWFHINGALSFFISAVKHFRRKNTRMIIVNIKAMFRQKAKRDMNGLWQRFITIQTLFKGVNYENRKRTTA